MIELNFASVRQLKRSMTAVQHKCFTVRSKEITYADISFIILFQRSAALRIIFHRRRCLFGGRISEQVKRFLCPFSLSFSPAIFNDDFDGAAEKRNADE